MTKILVGCDPEVFVKKNGVFRSAFGLITGDKKNPQKVPRGAVQVDGMALEFNIDPAASEEEFCINVQQVLNHMKSMVPDYEVVATPVAHFTQDYMKEQPKEALELGCDPDYNAWDGSINIKPNADLPMRTASGHVHIGWTDGQSIHDGNHVESCNVVGRQMDFFLGLPSLLFDGDKERRIMYGKGGCIRYKPYGVEYRTLSNAWLNSNSLQAWVFRAVQNGMASLMDGQDLSKIFGDVQDIINNNRIDEAKAIIEAANIEVCYG